MHSGHRLRTQELQCGPTIALRGKGRERGYTALPLSHQGNAIEQKEPGETSRVQTRATSIALSPMGPHQCFR
jgi:hypothetical protein